MFVSDARTGSFSHRLDALLVQKKEPNLPGGRQGKAHYEHQLKACPCRTSHRFYAGQLSVRTVCGRASAPGYGLKNFYY
ncbi:MAG TPA: hypothetical protein VJY62_08150 [Bacteroidia bacterium]|nr:hypothetical protein [Bacteroidia bacterium]